MVVSCPAIANRTTTYVMGTITSRLTGRGNDKIRATDTPAIKSSLFCSRGTINQSTYLGGLDNQDNVCGGFVKGDVSSNYSWPHWGTTCLVQPPFAAVRTRFCSKEEWLCPFSFPLVVAGRSCASHRDSIRGDKRYISTALPTCGRSVRLARYR